MLSNKMKSVKRKIQSLNEKIFLIDIRWTNLTNM